MQAAMRGYAQSIDDEDFVLMEAQAALDAMPICPAKDESRGELESSASPGEGLHRAPISRKIIRFALRLDPLQMLAQRPMRWAAAAAALLIGFSITALELTTESQDPALAPPIGSQASPACLRGVVGARWAGPQLELPEGEQFVEGQQLQLIEGLAEVHFVGGARVVLQGPAILKICDGNTASVRVGRIAAIVPPTASWFTLHTAVADLKGRQTEFGAEIDVDGSLVTRVYDGDVDICLNGGVLPRMSLHLVDGQGSRVDGKSGQAAMLEKPLAIQFVRYLPVRDSLVNLAEVVAGGANATKAYHCGLNMLDGRAADDYGAPVQSDGQYHPAQGVEYVDGVFIPNGKPGPVQVDSIGRRFVGFPATSGECWGGVIMARRPIKEDTLPLIRMEFYGDNYGYVNWLHIASKPDELSPSGYGLIGMHSNAGITFDLHAIRARYPDKKILRFRTLVGNLESRTETDAVDHMAEAWVFVDGQLRHHRRGFNRESGPEAVEVPLTDRDRFLVLAVTDDGGDTAYDWVAFGDAVIELSNLEAITSDDYLQRSRPEPAEYENGIDAGPRRKVSSINDSAVKAVRFATMASVQQ
jgi:hypothetical protein